VQAVSQRLVSVLRTFAAQDDELKSVVGMIAMLGLIILLMFTAILAG